MSKTKSSFGNRIINSAIQEAFKNIKPDIESDIDPEDVIAGLKECLISAINMERGNDYASGNFGETAVSGLLGAIFSVNYGVDANQKGTVEVGVGDVIRPSLSKNSGKTVDISGLLENGYSISPEKRAPRGEWHGAPKTALRNRAGSKYLEVAENMFMEKYGEKFNVISISINNTYDNF